ncbi:MAG: ATP-binding cassette domain-containing protein [Gammaproteobacteria bacterium]
MTEGVGPYFEVRGVCVRFGGLRALENVFFEVAQGELLALIGPNGAGKTTLLNVISGALVPTAGSVVFRGSAITGLGAHEVNARGVARTFQAVELFANMTVCENVMAGGVAGAGIQFGACVLRTAKARRTHTRLRETAHAILDRVGLAQAADQPAATLPAGQQRLLGIARALGTGAEVMIFDEPGAGLNEAEKHDLVRVIRAVAESGKTVLFVEHDMNLVGQLAGRIVVLDQGRVIAEGIPDVVRNNPTVVNAYLGEPHDSSPSRGRHRRPRRIGANPEPLLSVEGLTAGYGALTALSNVNLSVASGELVAVVGANGAGKSTLLKSIIGLATIQAGAIRFHGSNLSGLDASHIVSRGISLVPEGRELFPSLTVLENLALGQYARFRAKGFAHLLRNTPFPGQTAKQLERVYALFPVLKERRDQLAATLSGGQGQMLAIGRALMSDPVLLMLDEPSIGIAPQLVLDVFQTLVQLRDDGLTIVLVEQNARAALDIADRAYVLSSGEVVAADDARSLASDCDFFDAYLGLKNHSSAHGRSPARTHDPTH